MNGWMNQHRPRHQAVNQNSLDGRTVRVLLERITPQQLSNANSEEAPEVINIADSEGGSPSHPEHIADNFATDDEFDPSQDYFMNMDYENDDVMNTHEIGSHLQILPLNKVKEMKTFFILPHSAQPDETQEQQAIEQAIVPLAASASHDSTAVQVNYVVSQTFPLTLTNVVD